MKFAAMNVFSMERWKGVVNGEPLHISDIDDVTNAFLIVELPYNDTAYKQIAMHLLDSLYGRAGAIRMNGLCCCRYLLCSCRPL